MPLVAHIYPKGALIKDQHDAEVLAYAVRAGAELGVDIIKTMWSGSAESFRSVVDACPSIVALAGGEMGETLEDYLRMTRQALDVQWAIDPAGRVTGVELKDDGGSLRDCALDSLRRARFACPASGKPQTTQARIVLSSYRPG